MKTITKIFSVFLFLLIISIPHQALAQDSDRKGSIHFNEFSAGTGYSFGNLKANTDDFAMVPLFLDFGFNINSLLGLEDHKGTFQTVLEPFINPIINPEGGVAVGVGMFLKYSYPVWDTVSLYIEAGAAPMYFSIDTYEQGNASFNFLDQGGGGIKYHFADGKSFNVGYRRFHISDLGITDGPNGGINGDSVVASFSWYH